MTSFLKKYPGCSPTEVESVRTTYGIVIENTVTEFLKIVAFTISTGTVPYRRRKIISYEKRGLRSLIFNQLIVDTYVYKGIVQYKF